MKEDHHERQPDRNKGKIKKERKEGRWTDRKTDIEKVRERKEKRNIKKERKSHQQEK
jgi:hypothetical protein